MCFVAELQGLLADLLPELKTELVYALYMRTLLPGAPFAYQIPMDWKEPGIVVLFPPVLPAKTGPNSRQKNSLLLANRLPQPGRMDLLACKQKTKCSV
jgi:hypothetical protein